MVRPGREPAGQKGHLPHRQPNRLSWARAHGKPKRAAHGVPSSTAGNAGKAVHPGRANGPNAMHYIALRTLRDMQPTALMWDTPAPPARPQASPRPPPDEDPMSGPKVTHSRTCCVGHNLMSKRKRSIPWALPAPNRRHYNNPKAQKVVVALSSSQSVGTMAIKLRYSSTPLARAAPTSS